MIRVLFQGAPLRLLIPHPAQLKNDQRLLPQACRHPRTSESGAMSQVTADKPGIRAAGSPRTILGPGGRIESLEIEHVIGCGGHGPLYLARDPEFGLVAVKEFAPRIESPEVDLSEAAGENASDGGDRITEAADCDRTFAAGLTLFRLMGQALCTVRHPNLVAVRRCLEARGTAYLVMDHIEGPSLDQMLNEEQASPSGIALGELLPAILGALDRLHGTGLVHRDVTPANIRFSPDGVPVLVDFGAALPADLAAEPPYPGHLTPGYAAPEQYRTDAREGPWTDMYALAAVAYYVLTGAPPPDAQARAGGRPLIPAVIAGRDRYPEPLLASIDRALSLKSSERPQSAREWIAAVFPSETDQAGQSAVDPLAEQAVADAAAEADPPDRSPLDGMEGAEPVRTAAGSRRSWRWYGIAAAVLLMIALPAAILGGRTYHQASVKSEWIVDASGHGDVTSITDALAAAQAGATIRVRPGRYPEALVMAQPVTLQGVGAAEEIVVAPPDTRPCLTITAETGTISGLSLIGGGGGPSPAGACVDIGGGSAVTVSGTIIHNASGAGVRIGGTAAPDLRSNRIEHILGAAVIVEEQATGTVTDNSIVASGAVGILVRGTTAPLVSGNRIDAAAQAGILASGGSNARIADNRISNSGRSGIEVRGGADPAVEGNRIDGAGQAGIFVHEDGRGTFENNTIIGSAFSGVVVGAGSHPVMTSNRIEANNEHGILVLARGGGRYQRNIIADNGGYGIAVDVAADLDAGDLESAGNALSGNREPQIVIGEAPRPQPERRSQLGPAPAAP